MGVCTRIGSVGSRRVASYSTNSEISCTSARNRRMSVSVLRRSVVLWRTTG